MESTGEPSPPSAAAASEHSQEAAREELGEPTPPPEPTVVRLAESQREGTMTFERAVPTGGYQPGEPLNLALGLDYPADSPPVTALAAVEQLPDGWQFLEILSNPKPIIEPPKGATGTLNFVWAQVPSFPFQFSYTVQVPESEGGGTRQLAGIAPYRTDGPEETTALATTEIGPRPGP